MGKSSSLAWRLRGKTWRQVWSLGVQKSYLAPVCVVLVTAAVGLRGSLFVAGGTKETQAGQGKLMEKVG